MKGLEASVPWEWTISVRTGRIALEDSPGGAWGQASSANRRGRRGNVARLPPSAVHCPQMRAAAFAVLVLLAAAVPAAAQPAQIVISQPAEATTMDPGRSTQVLTVNYFVNLYDTLTRWDGALKLVPGLATSWKNVNDTTWEFTLRSGVKFHDGVPRTAEDAKGTLDRNLQPGRTVVQPGLATIETVEIVGPDTERVVTRKPDPMVPDRMEQWVAL